MTYKIVECRQRHRYFDFEEGWRFLQKEFYCRSECQRDRHFSTANKGPATGEWSLFE